MPKYLVRASLSQEGLKGTLAEGGTKRREAVERLTKSLGGTLESFYYSFGDDDLYALMDFPDNVAAATASMVVTAAGTGRISVAVLLTPEEVDRCSGMSAQYRPPGG